MSKVIKVGRGSSSERCRSRVRGTEELLVRFDLGGLPADDPVRKAREQAAIIVHTARSEADAIREEARAAGYEAGLADAAAAAQGLIDRLEEDIAAVEAEREAVVESVEPEVLKLCVEAVEKIIRHEIKTDPRVVVRTIKACLRRVKDCDRVDVRVNPEEVAQVRAQREELLSAADGARGLSVSGDRRVSAGGCVVESASGALDARIETQIEQLRSKVTETYENEHREAGSGPGELPEGDRQD